MKVRAILAKNNPDTERAVINDEWWLTKNLIEASKNLEVFDLDLMSIDLGVMPWECGSILHFTGHVLDMKKCDLKYPVILSPSGWIMNGWHRIVKAIIQGKDTIPAVRFIDMPDPDGTKEPTTPSP
jgi:hypothetical protein